MKSRELIAWVLISSFFLTLCFTIVYDNYYPQEAIINETTEINLKDCIYFPNRSIMSDLYNEGNGINYSNIKRINFEFTGNKCYVSIEEKQK